MRKTIPILIIASMLLVPVAYGITIDGQTNFQGPNGGTVRFDTTIVSNRINIVNTIWRFFRVTEGTVLMGNMGFDCDTGDIMTVTTIDENQVIYTTNGAGTQYIYYKGRAPSGSTNTATLNYDPTTDITTVTTAGATTVTIVYSQVSQDLETGAQDMAGVIGFLAVMLIFGAIGKESTDIRTKVIAYALMIAAVLIMAVVFANWGY